MRYLGGKARLSKDLIAVMAPYRKPDQWWVEPFVGGAHVISKVSGKRIGNDIHPYLIALLNAVKNGYEPPDRIDRETYYYMRDHKEEFPPELVGFAGFSCSVFGLWFGTYARDKSGHNYSMGGKKYLTRIREAIKDVVFTCGSYDEMTIPPQSLIYCDPPYSVPRRFYHIDGKMLSFDYDTFWDWCRNKAQERHTVFVSEYQAPDDFVCCFEKQLRSSSKGCIVTERLFRCEPR